jgi:hypothetical protein
MNLDERRARYQAIEEYRKRPLIVYATTTRPGVGAQMAGDAVREFIDQIDVIGAGDDIDILLHSTGGDALTAWKLMSLLRERFKNVGVLVPFMAFSAATLFTLGADEIVMHPHASLGPIDPQISIAQSTGGVRQFAYEDVGAFLRFLESEAKITEQTHLSSIIDKLFSVVDPVHIGAAKRASELSSSVGERLLLFHMTGSEDSPRAKQIAENLNKSFFAHADAVSRKRARDLQLKVNDSDTALEGLMWNAYLGLEAYFEIRTPFVPLQVYLANPAAATAVRPIAPAAIPANAPQQVVQQIWQGIAQQAMQTAAGVEVPYSVVNAVIESTRAASECRTSGRLFGYRNATAQIQLSSVDTESRWRQIT